VVASGKPHRVPQALAAADSQHRHQEQLPGRNANRQPQAGISKRPQKTDQVENGCWRSVDEQWVGTIPPT